VTKLYLKEPVHKHNSLRANSEASIKQKMRRLTFAKSYLEPGILNYDN